ncbi:hypothetical protein OnM2_025072 [Erysiphe neolycopersici]|uniref:Nascent polypeptide-associated complex subunit alpha-like UBA domain-containing protein n=1 Tax=Erysiphe neolycopersici TaxID=212602 RepID=A0A420I1D1_9PEZI|nr:hypothetical protein OnM2_025072 [Erysiphe neolycopersici]
MAPDSKKNGIKDEKLTPSSSSSAIDHEEDSSLLGLANNKSAEDRKTAAALSSIDDTSHDDCEGILGNGNSSRENYDQEAVKKAMERLDNNSTTAGNTTSISQKKEYSINGALPTSKNIKVDPADVTFIVEELELSKAKATSLLKSFDGDVQKTLRSYVHAE